jgi:hypothetical protein
LVAALLAWTFKMTFEAERPLIDPEHLYHRPVFLRSAIAVLVLLVSLALREQGRAGRTPARGVCRGSATGARP